MGQSVIIGDTVTFDGKISYIIYFTLFDEQEAAQQLGKQPQNSLLWHRIADAYPQAVFQDTEEEHPVFRDFKITQEFLHGGGLPFDCWRVLLCDQTVSMELAPVEKLQILFTVFPEINIGKLTFNLQFTEAATSQLVYLHHCNGNNAALTLAG